MIFKRYGKSYHSVTPNFDSRAMTEVGFQKSGEQSLTAEEFEQQYEKAEARELTATASGSVQDQAEREMLESLLTKLRAVETAAGSDGVVVIESEQGKDYPKTREKQSTLVAGHENKLHFEWSIEPPLRVAIFQPRKR